MAATAESFEPRLRAVEGASQEALLRLDGHEEVCAERYQNIHESVGGIKRLLSRVTIALLAGMAAILVKILFFHG